MPRNDIEPTTSYDQNWDDFDHIYIDFALEYSQQLLTLYISLGTFSQFPNNLPPGLIIPILAHRYKAQDDERDRRGLELEPEAAQFIASLDKKTREIASKPLDDFQTKISLLFESIYSLSRWGKKLDYTDFPDFERVILTQHIITVCSFAEGFYSNTVRYLADKPPYPFKAWKTISKKAKNSSKTDQELLDVYLFDKSGGNFTEKLSTLEQTHGISLNITEEQKKALSDLFLVRNFLVHNAGRATKFFITNANRWGTINHGELVPLEHQEIEELIDILIDAIVEIYRSCSITLLGKAESQLVWGSKRM
ncbi:MAG: hypothetical protein AAFP20_00680 [Cyanobacteria bacterium J06614_10]